MGLTVYTFLCQVYHFALAAHYAIFRAGVLVWSGPLSVPRPETQTVSRASDLRPIKLWQEYSHHRWPTPGPWPFGDDNPRWNNGVEWPAMEWVNVERAQPVKLQTRTTLSSIITRVTRWVKCRRSACQILQKWVKHTWRFGEFKYCHYRCKSKGSKWENVP